MENTGERIEFSDSSSQPHTSPVVTQTGYSGGGVPQEAQPAYSAGDIRPRTPPMADTPRIMLQLQERGEPAAWVSPGLPGPSGTAGGGTAEREQRDRRTPSGPGPEPLPDLRSMVTSYPWSMEDGSPTSGGSEDHAWSNPPDAIDYGAAPEPMQPAWDNLRDPAAQEWYMRLPSDAFRAELLKLPQEWAHVLRRRRHNLLSRCQYARRKERAQETERTNGRYELHLLRQNIKWESACQKAHRELGEVKISQARYAEKIEGMRRELTQWQTKVEEVSHTRDCATQQLAAAIITIGEQASSIHKLTEKLAKLQVTHVQLDMAQQGEAAVTP